MEKYLFIKKVKKLLRKKKLIIEGKCINRNKNCVLSENKPSTSETYF